MKHTPMIFAATAALAVATTNQAAQLPNIVLIYADDLGYGDLSCYGATAVSTPHIDRLAKEGVLFTSGYCASATCTPSRYALLTGEYAFRKKGTGVLPGDAALIIEPGRATLPSILQRAGYRTGIVGKWHLGLGSKANPVDWNGEIKPGPREVGFDYSFIMAATMDRVPCVYIENHRVAGLDPNDPIQVNYKKPFPGELIGTGVKDRSTLKMDRTHSHNDAIINGVGRLGFMTGGKSAIWKDEEMADVFVKQAQAFMDREKDQPFFLYFATSDIHKPHLPHPQFAGKTAMGPRGDSIVEFDYCVGEILKKLDELKLSGNTLIILSSDNGPVLDDGYQDDANEKLGDHRPAGQFRAGKYSLFEGGTRVPFIVRWPGKIKPGVSDAFISQVDLAATLGALTGQKLDADAMRDSQNVLPALLGESQTGRDVIVEHAAGLALRSGSWKYIAPGKTRDKLGPWENLIIPDPGWLFDLSTDPGETKNIAAEHPEKVRELAETLRKIAGGDPL